MAPARLCHAFLDFSETDGCLFGAREASVGTLAPWNGRRHVFWKGDKNRGVAGAERCEGSGPIRRSTGAS